MPTLKELKKLATQRKIKGRSKMNKSQLMVALGVTAVKKKSRKPSIKKPKKSRKPSIKKPKKSRKPSIKKPKKSRKPARRRILLLTCLEKQKQPVLRIQDLYLCKKLNCCI